MAEIVYPPVIAAARTLFRVLDLRIHIEGREHIPRTGGAVLVSNHISYLDFIFAGLGALPAKRLVRFMAKQEVFDHRISGPLMRGMHHIPVDRGAGRRRRTRRRCASLKAGEVVGVFPEATISRSFTVKEIKNGADPHGSGDRGPGDPDGAVGDPADVDQGPAQAAHPRHVPITILVGEPMHPKRGDGRDSHAPTCTRGCRSCWTGPSATTRRSPPGAWWLPAHLGGTAPTPEEAAAMDAAEAEARAKRGEEE